MKKKKAKIKSVKGFMYILLAVLFISLTLGSFMGERYIVPLMSAIDISLTYTFMRMYRKHIPHDKEWDKFEQNWVAKFIWGKLGLELGSIVLLILAMGFWYLFLFVWAVDYYFVGLFTGIYAFVLSSHILNLRTLRKEIKDDSL